VIPEVVSGGASSGAVRSGRNTGIVAETRKETSLKGRTINVKDKSKFLHKLNPENFGTEIVIVDRRHLDVLNYRTDFFNRRF
jgi:hypothetical protein